MTAETNINYARVGARNCTSVHWPPTTLEGGLHRLCVCVPLSPGVYVVVKKGERLQKENNKGKLYLSVSGGSGFSVWDVSVVVVEHSAPLVSSGFL